LARGWLDVEADGATRRVVLEDGRTVVGEGQADVQVPGAGKDRLDLWSEPPRAVYSGTGEVPRCGGEPFQERSLRPGDVLEWHGVRMCYGGEAAPEHHASLEELPLEPGTPELPPAGAGAPTTSERVTRRLLAGLLVEQGLADKRAARRWQDEVREGRYDADRCAQEILGASPVPDEMRLLERSARLQRDFLMAPLLQGTRGAGRRMRQATKSGVAFLVAQLVGLVVYSAVIVAIALFLRLRGVDFDVFLDRILMRK